MGIKNLHKFIKDKFPSCIHEMSLNDLKGKIVAIDTPCLMYKYKFGCFSDNKKDWINSLIFFILKMSQYEINCCFVNEGKAPVQKQITQENRVKARESVVKRTDYLKTLLNDYTSSGTISDDLKKEWDKLKQDTPFNFNIFKEKLNKRDIFAESITQEDYDIFNEILSIFSIVSVQSETEAETMCAFMNASNNVDYVYSFDGDVLAYDGVNGLIPTIDLKSECFTFIDKKQLLECIELDTNSFIDFCILCGTDYNKTIPKIGIVNAYKLIKNFKYIDNIDSIGEEEKRENYLNVCWIRDNFTFKHSIGHNNGSNLFYPWPKVDFDKLSNLMIRENSHMFSYVKEIFDKFLKERVIDDDDIEGDDESKDNNPDEAEDNNSDESEDNDSDEAEANKPDEAENNNSDESEDNDSDDNDSDDTEGNESDY